MSKEQSAMESVDVNITSQYTESLSTTEPSKKFDLTDYLWKNYVIIIIPSVFLCIFLIILFIILIKKLVNRGRFDPKQLETYASINYDDETLEEELDSSDDLMYTSCKLLVGGSYEENPELTNSEPEYDCRSVDVSVAANESAIVDWNKGRMADEATQDVAQSLKTIPHTFWKR